MSIGSFLRTSAGVWAVPRPAGVVGEVGYRGNCPLCGLRGGCARECREAVAASGVRVEGEVLLAGLRERLGVVRQPRVAHVSTGRVVVGRDLVERLGETGRSERLPVTQT